MSRFFSHRYAHLTLIVLTAIGLASINFRYGISEETDSYITLNRAMALPIFGHLLSKAWGFPLYELLQYPVIAYLGIQWGKVLSLIFYVLSGVMVFQIIHYLKKDLAAALLASLCLMAHPLSIISGNSLTDTSQGSFLALCAVYHFAKFISERKLVSLGLLTLFCALASATRLDYCFFTAALFLVLWLTKKISVSQALFWIFLYWVMTLSPYWMLYGVDHFSHLLPMTKEPLMQKWPKIVFGIIGLFGIPTFLFSVGLFLKRQFYLPRLHRSLLKDPFSLLFLAVAASYFIRLVLLPDKLEYIYILFPLFVIFFALLAKRKILLAILLVTIFLPNLLQIHFFEREGRSIRVEVGLSPGVFVQERTDRLKQAYYFGDLMELIKVVAREKFGCQKYVFDLPHVYDFIITRSNRDRCIVVPEERLRFWNPGGLIQDKELMQNKTIVYPYPDHRGWRKFYKFTPFKKLTVADFRLYNVPR